MRWEIQKSLIQVERTNLHENKGAAETTLGGKLIENEGATYIILD